MILKGLGIPDNFEEKLPNLKNKTLRWRNLYRSGTTINSESNISFYQNNGNNPAVGNLILVPALATNSSVDPLMKTIQYWGLTHRYNVFNIDTFLGDFERELTPEEVQKNTYPEFKAIVKQSIDFILPYTDNKPICIVGHCVSSTAISDILNDCVRNKEKLPVHGAVLFAPFPEIPQSKYDSLMMRRLQIESAKQASGVIDPVTMIKFQHIKFVCAMQNFIKTAESVKFEPEIMSQWGIPVSFVIAGRDKISPASRTKENLEKLNSCNGSTESHYLYIPNKKHSFEKFYDDSVAVIELIKQQRKKHQRIK